MNGGDAFKMFRSFADESDDTFLTDDQVTQYLVQGHREYRNFINGIDPGIFQSDITVQPNAKFLDLTTTTPVLMGASAVDGTKLDRLVRVARVNTTTDNELIEYLVAAPNEKDVPLWGYCFTNNKIIFGGTTNGAYRIEYIPTFQYTPAAPAVPVFSSTSTAYIDDLDAFHVVFVLMALQYYAIRDGASSGEITGNLSLRKRELQDFLMEGRHTSGHQFVLATGFNY